MQPAVNGQLARLTCCLSTHRAIFGVLRLLPGGEDTLESYYTPIVKRAYEWTYLYAALEPTSGESFCMYLPGMDEGCLKVFLEELSKRYPDQHLLVVLDGAPSHRSERIAHPENISFLMLPPRSPELDPAERWFQEFGRSLSNRAFESVALIQDALSETLRPYWESPSLLKRLTGYSWWVKAVEEAI